MGASFVEQPLARAVRVRRRLGLAIAVIGFAVPMAGCRLPATHLENSAPSNCADCHREIVGQWEESAHSRAWTNPQFVAATDGRRNEACLPCHAPNPLLEQPPTDPPQLRATRRESGVDCQACHSVACAYAGPYRSWGPHPVKKDRTRLPCSALCGSCHTVEYEEYLSLYAPVAEAAGEHRQCATCHMPAGISRLTQGHVLSYAHPRRIVHDHSLAGWTDHRPEGVVGIGPVASRRRADNQLEVNFTLTNCGAGHRIPTGRFGQGELRILVAVLGADGLTLGLNELALLPGDPRSLAPGRPAPFSLGVRIPESSQPAMVRVLVERAERERSMRYPLASGEWPAPSGP